MSPKEEIFKWLDEIFDAGVPAEVEAVYINLVESQDCLDVEFFGVGKFDPKDDDWACDWVFPSKDINLTCVVKNSSNWEEALQDISSVIEDYVNITGNHRRLSMLKRIGNGFGDSEITMVKDEI